MRPGAIATLAAMALGALLSPGSVGEVSARSSGILGAAESGCNCHGLATPGTVEIDAPGKILAGQKQLLTVRVMSAIPAHESNAQGGFALAISEGAIADSAAVQVSTTSRQATHILDGNKQRSWEIDWTAPENPGACSFQLNVAGLAANGDKFITGDAWSKVSTEILLDPGKDSTPPAVEITSPAENSLQVNDLSFPLPSAAGIAMTVVAGESVPILVRVTDGGGVGALTITDGDPLGTEELGPVSYDPEEGLFHFVWNTREEPPGPHTLSVEVTDCVGNRSAAERALLIL